MSKVVGKVDFAATPSQEKSGPAIGTFICGIASGAPNPAGAVAFLEWFTSSKVQQEFAGGGSAAVTGSALRDPALVEEVPLAAGHRRRRRQLGAEAEAPPTSRRWRTCSGTALNQALVQAISQKSGYQQIAQSHLTTAANQITAYLKQQGTYF